MSTDLLLNQVDVTVFKTHNAPINYDIDIVDQFIRYFKLRNRSRLEIKPLNHQLGTAGRRNILVLNITPPNHQLGTVVNRNGWKKEHEVAELSLLISV
jgi:hypothetical protein